MFDDSVCFRESSAPGVGLEIMLQQPATRICTACIFALIGIVDVMAAISFDQNPDDLPVENLFSSTLLPGASAVG